MAGAHAGSGKAEVWMAFETGLHRNQGGVVVGRRNEARTAAAEPGGAGRTRRCVGADRSRAGAMQLRAMAVEFPEVHGHPNRLPFEGCLTLVDVASDRAPSGARGHRVVLTRDAAEAALPSLLGMAVDYKAGWDGHDARQKCGIITAAHLQDRKLMVSGFLFARDYPELGPEIEAAGHTLMGMSYELADAHVADMRAATWTLTRATFTGAAILLREKAAYRGTSFKVRTCSARGAK